MGAFDTDPSPALRAFLERAAGCTSYPRLRAAFLDAGNVIGVQRWGITLLGPQLETLDVAGRNVSDAFIARYEDRGKPVDPLLAAVAARHVAVHNMQVSRDWWREQLYRDVMCPFRFEHSLTAPVVGDRRLRATLHFVRGPGDDPFADADVAMAMAIANHVSSLLSRFDCDEEFPELTAREVEIGKLVASGLNNTEVARCLGITKNTVKDALKRLFRKVGVDSRAEMSVRLSEAGLL